jgi:sugar/nucleoside kinase (ribokinase family)
MPNKTNQFDVISIGSATVDIFIKSKDLIISKDIIGLKPSSKNEIDQSLICSGGGATNSSVAFSQLGLKSTPISLIGSSYLNQYIFDDLKKAKVSDQFIYTDKKDTTDYSVILVPKNARRTILTNRGLGSLQSKHIPWNKIKKTKWFYISSLEGNLDLLETIIGFANENSIKIALNPGKREFKNRRQILSLVKMADFLLLNREESELLFNQSFDDIIAVNLIHQSNIPIVAITAGANGAYIFSDSKQFYSPAVNSKPVDETGAGDAFGATFVSALIYKKSPQDALFWAVKNSASVVSQLGSKPGLLTLKQIKI